MNEQIKCKLQLSKQLFPKTNLQSGEYGILSMKVEDMLIGEPHISKWGTITIVGHMCTIEPNEIYTFIGKETENEKYGVQYEVIYIGREVAFTSLEDQRIFLSKILTDKQFTNMFNTFDNPITVIEKGNIQELCTVPGIGVKTALTIVSKFNETKDYSGAYIALNAYGLTNKMINKLIQSYNSPDILIEKVKENPYIIADEVDGIGWSKADEIALNSGYEEFSINRLKAYIKYYLKDEALNGNSYVYMDELLDSLYEIIGEDIPDYNIDKTFKELSSKDIWVNADQTLIGLKDYYDLEYDIAKELIRLLKGDNHFNYENWKTEIKKQEQLQGWEYTNEQLNAIKTILDNNVVLLSGSAGTGKTSTVAGVLSSLSNYNFAQTALSGKASVNLTDVTGEEGYTIHRLLGYNPSSGFTYNSNNKIDKDGVILDELSMVDGLLFYKLIQSIPTGSKLIMLGDTGQLECIGVANVMQDIIDSGVIPHAELTQIHRQAAKSAIIVDSMKIRHSEQITDSDTYGVEIRGEIEDLLMDVYKNKESTFDKIITYTKEALADIDDIMDMQILVPMKTRGEACTYKINVAVQQLIHKNHNRGLSKEIKSIEIGNQSKTPYTLYVGDKIINVKNNYNTVNISGEITPIYNGNLGIVKDIDTVQGLMIIDFQNIGEIVVESNHFCYIELGYAITVHKAQGSGFKYLICGLDYSHYSLLTREMVYTMLTRAKKHCILCTQNKALRYAITQSNVKTKQTFLQQLLKDHKSELLNNSSLN